MEQVSCTPRKSITLAISKEVNPQFDKNDCMTSIMVGSNTVYSLIANELVDQESILEINEIVLVSKVRSRTLIPIQNDGELRTRELKNGSIEFFVQKGEKIKRGKLVMPRIRKSYRK